MTYFGLQSAPLTVLSYGMLVFSQVDATSPTTAIGALIAGFTLMTGLMVWIVKRMLDTTIPGLEDTFRTSLDGQRVASMTVLLQQQTTFLTTLDSERTLFRQESQAARDLFEKKLTFERELFERQLAVIMEDAKESREAFSTVLKASAESARRLTVQA